MSMRFHSHERFFWHAAPGGLAAVDPWTIEPTAYFDGPVVKRRCLHLLDACSMFVESGGPLIRNFSKPRLATLEELSLVHDPAYVNRLRDACRRGETGEAGEECPFGPITFDVASRAAASCIDALKCVLQRDVPLGYCLPRPPGHHAERSRGMGFCVFGNVALACASALHEGTARRLIVVDIDVHHGNGTQEAFWEDPRVLFISVHQEGCYPEPIGPDGKTRAHGALTEAGGGAGAGTTINVPLPPGCGHGAYSDAFSRVVEPAARRFGRCDAIVVSAGYDAGYFDPLARQALGGTAFFDMGMRLRALAEELCEGRLLAVHEGGYSEFHTPFLCLRFIEGLLTAPGERPFVNPEGKTDPFQDGIDKVGAGTNELQVWQAEAVDRAVRAAGLA